MKVHFIPKPDGGFVMFFCDSLRFYNVNAMTKAIVEAIVCGVNPKDIIQRYQISETIYSKIARVVEEGIKCRTFLPVPVDKITKLTFHVSNACNLACSYCYANCGTYQSTEGLMTIDTAKKAIDAFVEQYHVIDKILFFGGEPMLNVDVIEFICEYCTYKHEKGELQTLPLFGMVSNGTIYTERIASLIQKYKITLTISLDGPAEVNDELRRYKTGATSTRVVINNIRNYKESTGEPHTIEATYTGNHTRNGLTPLNIAQFIKDELNVDDVALGPVSVDTSSDCYVSDYDYYLRSVDETFEQYQNGKNYLFTPILSIMENLSLKDVRIPSCSAARSTFAISSKGEIFPCHLFMDKEEYLMGNVCEDWDNNKRFSEIQRRFVEHSSLKACEECFARGCCIVCPGANETLMGDAFIPDPQECVRQKQLIERILINLAKLKEKTVMHK